MGRKYKPISPSTVERRHANIRKAIQFACNMDIIDKNVADRVQLPKAEKFEGSVYTPEQLEILFEKIKGTKIEFAVHVTAFYDLRREKVVGLKWSNIDFERKTIFIKHVVTETTVKGKLIRTEKDRTKNKLSLIELPLVKPFEDLLRSMLEQRNKNMIECGNKYSMKYMDYIYVDRLGHSNISTTANIYTL